MAVSAAEQYLLELINRARLDPLAEAERYGLDLNNGLEDGTISDSPKQVLAYNTDLEAAAMAHSEWMLDTDTFSHEGEDGTDPGDRIAAAGYDFTGTWTWGENLAWTGSTGSVDLAEAIETHHEGLYRSETHRVNTFAEVSREVGIAQIAGLFVNNGTTYNSSMLTVNFASSGSEYFITGVVYTDSDKDDFYSIGEGEAGLTFRVAGDSDVSAAAGGYSVAAAPTDDVAVAITLGSTTLATLEVDLTDGNAKLDVVTDTSGTRALALSADATLLTGITDAVLLGAGDLNLTGSADDNTLIGNGGANTLFGGAGDDTLSGGEGADLLYGGAGDDVLEGGIGRDVSWDNLVFDSADAAENADILIGGTGNDTLYGQSGNDVLDGGAGDDWLIGGGGRDTFIFNEGSDVILDFTDRVDNIELDGGALGISTVDEAMAMGQISDGNAVFDFGGHDVLQVNGVDDLSLLVNDLMII